MFDFAVNHMTTARASYESLLDVASALGCVGVELRNDLGDSLFDGSSPADAKEAATIKGLRILTLAEVKSFNHFTHTTREQATALAETAAACGAEAISLIPANDGTNTGDSEQATSARQADLKYALLQIQPLLEQHNLIGLIEPLGFASSSLRSKAEAVQAIESIGATHCYKLVHDTFHHNPSGGGQIFADQTGMVHISGVVDPAVKLEDMVDEHRVLIDQHDRLGNLEQLSALRSQGYTGPVSIESFAPVVHAFTDPESELSGSFDYIATSLAASAA